MPIGICKLCLQNRDLQKSHLLPAALYRLSRWQGDPNPNPWEISARGQRQTSKQIQDYVFCRDCEERFCKYGERYAMGQVNRNGNFALLNTLRASEGEKSSAGFTFYNRTTTPNIDREKLGYFALSVFWRAGIHLWHRPQQKKPMIELGKLREPIRKYLLGETPFPKELALILYVCTDSFSQNAFYEPNMGNDSDPTMWSFEARGLNFYVCGVEGKQMNVGSTCLVNGEKQLIVVRDCQKKVLSAAIQLAIQAELNKAKR
jgi:hypothetical protein